jgi:transposase
VIGLAKFKPYLFEQGELTPSFLSDWIPESHLVRTISDIVDAMDLSQFFARYTDLGEEAYHPHMMVKILIYGYATKVFSSRELQQKTQYDICFRWLCGLGQKPNFRTISDFRKNNLDLLPKLFTDVLEVVRELGYASLGHVSIDGSKIKANASKHKAMSRERMKQELAKQEREIRTTLEAAQREDELEATSHPRSSEEASPRIDQRREKIQAALAELERRKPAHTSKEPEKDQINFTDPDSRIMDTKNQGIIQAYNPQIAVDADNGFIVGLAMSNHANDQKQLEAVLHSIEHHMGMSPEKMSADAGYFSATNIQSCEAHHVDAYIAATREGKQAGNSFDKSNFTYDADQDVYICPAGKILSLKHTQNANNSDKPTTWKYECNACRECPFQKDCTKSKSGLRQVSRTEADPIRERMRTKVQSDEGRAIYRRRKAIVEPVWGQMKQVQGFRQFLLWGEQKVAGEFMLLALAYNMRKLHAMEHPKPDTAYRRERSAQKQKHRA